MAVITQDDFLNDTSQFDLARKRAADQSATNLQARKDALARRFAALGNLDSGARLKQESLAQDQEAANLTNANEGINAQQQAEMQRRREVIQAQNYQTGERESAQKFASGEAEKQRAYGTSERQGAQEFTAGENAAQRNQQESQFARQYGLSQQQFTEAKNQFEKTFAEEVRVNNANMSFAQQVLDKKDFLEGLTGNLFGGSGVEGAIKGSLAGGLIMGPVGSAYGAIKGFKGKGLF